VKHERRQKPKSKRFEMLLMASVSNGLTKLPRKASCGDTSTSSVQVIGKLSFDRVNEETQKKGGKMVGLFCI